MSQPEEPQYICPECLVPMQLQEIGTEAEHALCPQCGCKVWVMVLRILPKVLGQLPQPGESPYELFKSLRLKYGQDELEGVVPFLGDDAPTKDWWGDMPGPFLDIRHMDIGGIITVKKLDDFIEKEQS